MLWYACETVEYHDMYNAWIAEIYVKCRCSCNNLWVHLLINVSMYLNIHLNNLSLNTKYLKTLAFQFQCLLFSICLPICITSFSIYVYFLLMFVIVLKHVRNWAGGLLSILQLSYATTLWWKQVLQDKMSCFYHWQLYWLKRHSARICC